MSKDPSVANALQTVPLQVKYICDQLPDGGIAVQAGAHWGAAPALLAEHFDVVYTYEPSLANFRRLVANTPDNVIPIFGMLLDKHGTGGLTENKYNSGDLRTLPDGNIPRHKIDDLELEKCDLIWLDIQGDEFEALRGAHATIKLCHPMIGFEFCPTKCPQTEDVEEFLTTYGYEFLEQKNLDRFYRRA